jgi:hypothetical protein
VTGALDFDPAAALRAIRAAQGVPPPKAPKAPNQPSAPPCRLGGLGGLGGGCPSDRVFDPPTGPPLTAPAPEDWAAVDAWLRGAPEQQQQQKDRCR